MLRDMMETGGLVDVTELPHASDFYRWYGHIPRPEQIEMERHIVGLLDQCARQPDKNWGSILNTSIEGGKPSPATGIRGDWTGTPYAPLWEACGQNDDLAAMVFGNLWKLMVIRHPKQWIGIRADPTFPTKGITLQGKTYFVATESH